MKTIMYIIAFILILFTLNDKGYSFEIDGFQSGVDIEVIANNLEERPYISVFDARTGREVTDNIKLNGREPSLVVYDSSDPNKLSLLYVLSFCEGKLVQLHKELDPSFKNFTLMCEKLTQAYGKAIDYDIRNSNVEVSHESYSLSIIWKIGAERKKLTYTHHETKTSYNYDQLYIVHKMTNECFN